MHADAAVLVLCMLQAFRCIRCHHICATDVLKSGNEQHMQRERVAEIIRRMSDNYELCPDQNVYIIVRESGVDGYVRVIAERGILKTSVRETCLQCGELPADCFRLRPYAALC